MSVEPEPANIGGQGGGPNTMPGTLNLLTFGLILCGAAVAQSKPPNGADALTTNALNTTGIEKEIRQFFDEYADDLRQQRRDAIADRYDSRGAFFLGHGIKVFEDLDS